MSFIEIKDLRKCYKNGKEALVGANFALNRGEVFALLGVNGAGKTTLSTILASLHPPSSGSVHWEGKSIYDKLLSYRKIVGFCPQYPNIDATLTMEDNLLLSGRCYGLSKSAAASRCDELLSDFDLGTYRTSLADELSGGYRQRFLIARALMHKPELLILDEPTVGLDPHIRRQIWKIINQLRSQKITIVLTTHYLDEAEELSDRVCMIHDGKIKTINTPEKLMEEHEKNTLEEVFLKFVDEQTLKELHEGES